MSSERVTAAVAAYQAACQDLLALDVEPFTHTELLDLQSALETTAWQMPTLSHRILARLQAEASPIALGAKNLREVLTTRLRISAKDATRRLAEATELGPRRALTGQPLAPVLEQTAAAQAAGRIGAEHVTVIRTTMGKLPLWVDTAARDRAETSLATAAAGLSPDALREVAALLLNVIDPDGPVPNDADRARKRGLWIGKQDPDGMTPVRGNLDPNARATIEALFAKLAAPGMANPDDDTPRTTGTPTQEQIDTDTRSVGQRNHDALTAIGRSVLSSGQLGRHNGLPVTIIVSTTLQDLEAAAGSAVTAGGTLLPMSDVIRMASHARHYLRIYDKHTTEELYLGRTKRLAPAGHRIVLHARDRGCTFPGCTVPGYGTQVHHTTGWAKHHGNTDVDAEVLACGPHNRLAETGWVVTIHDGQVRWTPPPPLDTGQHRVNPYHHPERILNPERILTPPGPPDGLPVDTG